MEPAFIRVEGRLVSLDSLEGKERMKWEKPYRYEPFPRMLYKAQKRPDGVVSVSEADDRRFGGLAGAAEQFTRSCQLIVRDEYEFERAKSDGWRESQREAMAYHEGLEKDIADAAAFRAYEDRNMGERAKAEAEGADAESFEHVASIPEKRRSRKGAR